MLYEVIHLCKDDENVTLTTYVTENRNKSADAMLVIPGGGYEHVCADREGESIAVAFAAHGFQCFVLNYSLAEKAKFPRPLIEASLAMAHIRANAEKYGINPERVFVCGFSAGGHLAASLGTRWHTEEVNSAIDIPFGANRPTAMILAYPVLCYFEKTHMGTFKRAFGTDTPTPEQIEFCSLERGLDDHTPPAFLWHTADDGCVNVENSLRMATALSRAKIPFELHVYPHGPHGMALASPITGVNEKMINSRVAEWVSLAAGFIASL